MADCHDLFKQFDGKIAVSSDRKGKLRTSRNATRERIRKHFIEKLEVAAPTFHGQGSYKMGTLINPLEGDDYDIDDGLYLQHLGDDRASWPSASTVHGWIMDAVADSTDEPPQDRPRCVRVIYKATPPYHIDIPAYVEPDDVPLLFDTSSKDSPYESDPRAMAKWFIDKVDDDEQLRRVVRYSKGWKDFNRAKGAGVARGLTLTILMTETFVPDVRDDVAFSNTVDAAYARLVADITIKKPVTPFENLTASWTQDERQKFLERLKQLRDGAKDAVNTAATDEGKAAASRIWRQLLGDRFPEFTSPAKKEEREPQRTTAPAVLGNHGRSA
jgi:hypothetical protein